MVLICLNCCWISPKPTFNLLWNKGVRSFGEFELIDLTIDSIKLESSASTGVLPLGVIFNEWHEFSFSSFVKICLRNGSRVELARDVWKLTRFSDIIRAIFRERKLFCGTARTTLFVETL